MFLLTEDTRFHSFKQVRTKLDCQDEQGLVALFKHSLMKYRFYLRQEHFDGKPLNKISVKSLVLRLSNSDWNNLVTHWSRLQRKVLSMISHQNLNYISACALTSHLYENYLQKNIHSRGTTESRNYTAHCIALVSTSCTV